MFVYVFWLAGIIILIVFKWYTYKDNITRTLFAKIKSVLAVLTRLLSGTYVDMVITVRSILILAS